MATDPAVAMDRLAASVVVPDGPIDQPPRAPLAGMSTDALRGALLAELACIELGEWDLAVVGWTARVGDEYALTLASLIRRAYHAGPEPRCRRVVRPPAPAGGAVIRALIVAAAIGLAVWLLLAYGLIHLTR